MPKISVVIPTYNSAATISQCLRALRGSSFKDYEIIVSDCGSQDNTAALAQEYCDILLKHTANPGRQQARLRGFQASCGTILVNIDSDVIIDHAMLGIVNDFFTAHPEADAVTGLLSKENPFKNYFSQYKTLYMHYMFRRLPERITFLYGSIYAIRKDSMNFFETKIGVADDTAFGQNLIVNNRKIFLLKNLEVIHLKKHSLLSFARNDFLIPFEWAHIFLSRNGWRQLGKNKTGFAHSSKAQLSSIIAAFLLCATIAMQTPGTVTCPRQATLLLAAAWFILNKDFAVFLKKEKGLLFGLSSLFVTFFDNMVMSLGIVCGAADYVLKKIKSSFKKK